MNDDKKEYIVIRLPKPSERFVWAVIVLILISLVFWNPFDFYSKSGGDLSAAATASGPKVETVVPPPVVKEEVAPPVVKAPEVLPAVQTPPVEKKEPVLSGLFTVEITDVIYDRPAGANYVKVKSVPFKIDNQKKEYNLLLQVKIFKDSDTDISKDKVRGEMNLPLKAGKIYSSEIPITSGTWLKGDKINVLLIVKDFNKDEVLTQKKTLYTVE